MPVLLLRSPSDHDDPYHDAFNNHPAGPALSVAVLATNLIVDDLAKSLHSGPNDVEAVVINSQRAVDALSKSLVEVDSAHLRAWSNARWYVVGSATGAALRNLPFPFELDVRGEQSGSASDLAKVIIGDAPVPRKVLDLVGDKSRDDLPQALEDAGIAVQKVKVYETGFSPSFPSELRRAVEELDKHAVTSPWWIGFFAPSSTSMAFSHLLDHFTFTFKDPPPKDVDLSSTSIRKRPVELAAIGKTTETHLREVCEVQVDAIASKPDAPSLARAIGAASRH
jgi:uroporphyrinogen-III synthase